MGQIIVIGNEKGGAGKSTVAAHLALALIHDGARVAVLDLDVRQRSLERLFQNREAWARSQKVELLWPVAHGCADGSDALAEAMAAPVDFVVIDTPGADTALSRAAHRAADLIITPMNDSFVDFDVLGEVDPVSLAVTKPSIYAEVVWEARKARAAEKGSAIDWVVLRNRLAPSEARNRRRVDERLAVLGRRIGFRPLTGLRDRVIYRELYPFGLTVSDLTRGVRPVPVSMGYVLARQELRMLLYELSLSGLATAAE